MVLHLTEVEITLKPGFMIAVYGKLNLLCIQCEVSAAIQLMLSIMESGTQIGTVDRWDYQCREGE